MSHALCGIIRPHAIGGDDGPRRLTAQAEPRPDHLTIGLLPGESAPTVMRLNEPLRAYLENRLNVKVELVVGANYAATGEALRFGRLDIAYLGPVTYILRSRTPNSSPSRGRRTQLMDQRSRRSSSRPAECAAKSLGDLKGQDIAFGDPASTSGTWVPRYQLLKRVLFPGATICRACWAPMTPWRWRSPAIGSAPAGLSKPIFERLVAEGRIDAGKVKILAESPDIPEYMWTFREGDRPRFQGRDPQGVSRDERRRGAEGVSGDSFRPRC